MRLLLDENLPPRLARNLSDLFPGSRHVEDCALGAASDTAIWAYSKANGFSILSKDSDFSELSAIEGAPPKVIWLRVGNVRPVEIEMLIRNRTGEIGEFLADPERPCLVIARKLPRCEQNS